MLVCPLLLGILHTGLSVPEDPVYWVLRESGDLLSSCSRLLAVCFLCGPTLSKALMRSCRARVGTAWAGNQAASIPAHCLVMGRRLPVLGK